MIDWKPKRKQTCSESCEFHISNLFTRGKRRPQQFVSTEAKALTKANAFVNVLIWIIRVCGRFKKNYGEVKIIKYSPHPALPKQGKKMTLNEHLTSAGLEKNHGEAGRFFSPICHINQKWVHVPWKAEELPSHLRKIWSHCVFTTSHT